MAQPEPALGTAPVLARFTQELGGFASKAAKLREATRALLEEPRYRAAAEAISASFDDGAQRAADLIDAMTR